MASPAEVMQPLPDTLPDDFSEWDSGLSSATVSVNHNGFKPAPVKPVPDVKLAPVKLAPVKPAPAYDDSEPAPQERSENPQVKVLAVMDGSTPAPPFSATDFYATHDDFLESKRKALARAKRKRLMLMAAGVTPVLFLLVFIPLHYSSVRQRLTAVKQSIVNRPSSPEADSAANRLKPSPATPMTKVSQPVVNTVKLSPSSQPAPATQPTISAVTATTETAEATPPQVEPTMMNNQLAAPKRIPHDINVAPKPEAPPSSNIGVAGIDGLNSGGNGVGTSLGANSKAPKVSVEIPEKVNISGGVAAAMRIHTTVPQYPAIAKSARVSGTVVLEATISKVGTVENLRVIAGPAMLRQAALNAVTSWRYRPCLFNGQPVEMETTVNVVFTIPGE
jgi:TonB family protein